MFVLTMCLLVFTSCLFFSIFFLKSVMVFLISLEFLVLCLLAILMELLFDESLFEVVMFLVFVVMESLLGMILMVLKVLIEGGDTLEMKSVF